MASVLQTIFSIDKFKERFLIPAQLHALMCQQSDPSQCLECQMHKLADGLLSGRYSHPRPTPNPESVLVFPSQAHNPQPAETPAEFQEGIKPTMFKALIGKGHEEFSTMRQQDSEEFFGWLVKSLRQDAKKKGADPAGEPTETFRFGFEQRLECGECHKVRYRIDSQDSVSVPVSVKEKAKVEGEEKAQYEPVELLGCLEMLTGVEALEYRCPSCDKNLIAQK